MRTLILVSAIFLALCTVIFLNYRYINKTADDLTSLAESLTIDDPLCLQKIKNIETRWNKSSTIFSLTVSFKDIDYLGEMLLSLQSATKSGNHEDFERYKRLLVDAIDGVRRLERFSIINIL